MRFSRMQLGEKAPSEETYRKLAEALQNADAVMVGVGAGLSTSAGFTYTGERFNKYFADFAAKYGFADMYSGGFTPFDTPEENWAYWSRYVWINRYHHEPKPAHRKLFDLVKDKDYFVLNTNVDHGIQKAGFDKQRLFYTQGDYGLLQCSKPCHYDTYDNKDLMREMLVAQGFLFGEDEELIVPVGGVEGDSVKMEVPSDLVPRCPKCGAPMSMNLRADNTFVEDAGWHAASLRYEQFCQSHADGNILYLELGVGFNTPVIVKYNFWQRAAANPQATYVCLNYGEAAAPVELLDQSILVNGDIIATFDAVEQIAAADL